MTATDGTVWVAILAIAVGTFALRFGAFAAVGRIDELPPALVTALEFVPAAVLAALVAPALFVVDGAPAVLGNEQLLAGAVAAVVAWRTENILATAVVGVGVLALLGWFL